MKNLELNAYGVNELSVAEMQQKNGGHFPMAWYSNDATIKENGKNAIEFWSFIGGVIGGFFGI
jgi:hypothetical protein